MKLGLSITWFFFGLMFVSLAVGHWNASQLAIEPFEPPGLLEREGDAEREGSRRRLLFLGVDHYGLIGDFVSKFNEYLSEYNKASSEANLRAFWSSLGAAVMAFTTAGAGLITAETGFISWLRRRREAFQRWWSSPRA